MLNLTEISAATPDQYHLVAATLADAFFPDPALRWIMPDDAQRRAMLPRLFAHLVRVDARAGLVTRSAGDEAAALWRAPGQAAAGALEYWASLLPYFSIFGTALPRALKVAGSIDAHRPGGDFWYLHFVGVRSDHQGKGHGGRIIRAQTAAADAAGRNCWLETATPENVPLYERLGFVTQAEWDVPGGGPHFWGMLRTAQPPPLSQ
jgi:ribosomal protein S18 acetylase RimI-like enzyme